MIASTEKFAAGAERRAPFSLTPLMGIAMVAGVSAALWGALIFAVSRVF